MVGTVNVGSFGSIDVRRAANDDLPTPTSPASNTLILGGSICDGAEVGTVFIVIDPMWSHRV